MSKTRILVVDDHAVVCRAISRLLSYEGDLEVVGEAGDAATALEMVGRLEPDVVLLDLLLPGAEGADLVERIHHRFPNAPMIVLTASEDSALLLDAVRAGARGYLQKVTEPDALFEAVRTVAQGRTHIPSELALRMVQEAARRDEEKANDPMELLSGREKDVLSALARGLKNRDIAGELGIAENTVKNHLRNVLEKLNMQNRVQAALFAKERGL